MSDQVVSQEEIASVDVPTLRLAIVLKMKANVEKIFDLINKENDLMRAAQLYRDIGSELERVDAMLKKLPQE